MAACTAAVYDTCRRTLLQNTQDVASAKSGLSLAGAALSLQTGATYALQGQLNSTRAAAEAAAGAEAAARSNVTQTAGLLADALSVELEKKSLMYQIIELGEKTRAAGDPGKQLGLIQVAIDEATADADKASKRVAELQAAKAAADAGFNTMALVQGLVTAKVGGIEAIMALAKNETSALQVRGWEAGRHLALLH